MQANVAESNEDDASSDFEGGDDVASSPQHRRWCIVQEPDESGFEIERVVACAESEVIFRPKSLDNIIEPFFM